MGGGKELLSITASGTIAANKDEAEVVSKAAPRDVASIFVEIDEILVEDANNTEATSKAAQRDISTTVKATPTEMAADSVPVDAPVEAIPNETARTGIIAEDEAAHPSQA